MKLTTVTFEPGREWVWLPSVIPAASVSAKACQGRFISGHDTHSLAAGTVCVEALRNKKGVLASVVLPNGCPFPTSRSAPNDLWFMLLKSHLRSWLALSEEARLYRISCEGLERLNEAIEESDYTPSEREDAALAVSRLESFRDEALGDLPKSKQEKDILASFYDWVVTTSSALKMPQKHFLEIINRGLRQKEKVEVADLDPAVFKPESLTRYLNIAGKKQP